MPKSRDSENSKPSLREREEEVLRFWEEKKIFQKATNRKRKGKGGKVEEREDFIFYEGPPSANGLPGIHHVLGRTLKDVFCRYQTMMGKRVMRRAGWDAHGLPIELEVEKQLGITKEDIGRKVSVEQYNSACRRAVTKYKKEWDTLTRRIGFWLDLEKPYATHDKDYIETVWSLLAHLYRKGLLYKGHAIQPYSPAAGTSLSNHELNQPGCYKEVKDLSLVAQFKVKDTENDYLLAWTTTPWTLPANNALAVGTKLSYVKVRTLNPYTLQPIQVFLAKERLSAYFSPEGEGKPITEASHQADACLPYEIMGHYTGADLVGMSYEQLMPYIPLSAPALRVYAADFVTTREGTGIVHIAGTFGADDYKLCSRHGIPNVLVERAGKKAPIVDEQGRFVPEISDFAGRYVKAAYGASDEESVDVSIVIHLKKANKAFRVEKFSHSYPHCWRTDKPIIYYPISSWFVKTTAYKDALIKHNKKIKWHPETIGTGRFGDWLKNLVDWNVGRSRFWGTPLPIWSTADGAEWKCVGSYAELRREVKKAMRKGFMDQELPVDFDPHRPYIDEVVLCSKDGQRMRREEEVLDVWFDSGAMPYAQPQPRPHQHYLFKEGKKPPPNFPADFIAEGVDQTRGWFFSLHVLGVMLFDQPAFKRALVNGLVLDGKGHKMSKRLGNTVDVSRLLDVYGSDAVRWYLISSASLGEDIKFTERELQAVRHGFFNTLDNVCSFFKTYAKIDGFSLQHGALHMA